MQLFTIPQGADFQFDIQVKEKDSYSNRDLTNMTSAVFEVFEYDGNTSVFTAPLNILDEIGGLLRGNLVAAQTSLLNAWMSPVADREYVKSRYHATIVIAFSDSISINIYIDQVFVSPTGV